LRGPAKCPLTPTRGLESRSIGGSGPFDQGVGQRLELHPRPQNNGPLNGPSRHSPNGPNRLDRKSFPINALKIGATRFELATSTSRRMRTNRKSSAIQHF
jgi:hypothetical protein